MSRSTTKHVASYGVDFESLFDSLGIAHIVFGADDPKFTVLAQNDEHARISLVKKGSVVGKPLLEAYPDTSEKYLQTGKSDLIESLRRVIRTGKTDSMPTLKYDLQSATGAWEKRYWQVSHHPLFDPEGKVYAIYQVTRDITLDIAADEKHHDIEERFHLAAKNGLISTWNWDMRAQKVFADENLSALFGMSSAEGARGVAIDRFIDSIHEDDRSRIQKEIKKAVESGTPYEAEYRTMTPSGIKHVIARGAVEKDDKGMPISFPGIIIDISERKIIETQLAESESRLRFMANSMPQLVWITRPDGYHEYYNERWYEYTGTQFGSTDGEGWNELFHPNDRDNARKKWDHSLKTGEPYEIEYRLYHAASRSYRWVIGRALPYRDTEGDIIKWYGTCTDINDVKLGEESMKFLSEAGAVLAESLDYRKTLHAIAQLVIPNLADWCSIELLDSDGQLQQVALSHKNPKKIAWAKALRKKQGPPDMNAPAGIAKVIRTGEPDWQEEIPEEVLAASAKDEEELKLLKGLGLKSYIVVPLKLEKRTVGAITLITSELRRRYTHADLDMAEELAVRVSLAIKNSELFESAQQELKQRKRLERELKKANQRLEERVKARTEELQLSNASLARSNKELEDFAYVASHDLQEPLRKIQAFGNLLEEEYGEKLGEGSDYLRRMQNAAARMSSLISDLLSFSRVSTKRLPLEKIELGAIVSEVLEDLEGRIAETKGTVRIGPLPSIYADPLQMRQLFQNLVANALKFHTENATPQVNVSAKVEEGSDGIYDVIEVADNGVGFDEKYLDRIFSVFQRLHGREQFEGTGIGLAVCRKIMERHGGTISAKSKPAQGATFIMKFPREQQVEGERR